MKRWWLCRDGVVHGPYDHGDVLQWLNQGTVYEADQLAEEGTENWVCGKAWALENDEAFYLAHLKNEVAHELRFRRIWDWMNLDPASSDFKRLTLKECFLVIEFLDRVDPGWSTDDNGKEVFLWESEEVEMKARVGIATLFPEKIKARSLHRYQ